MKFDEGRRFGVEIEFNRPDRYSSIESTAYRLSELSGLQIEPERYNHDTRVYWKLTTDASCGFELVSPILRGREGLEQIKSIMKGLKALGAKIDKRCGLHVHHEASDFNLDQLRSVAKLYAKYEAAIDGLVRKGRRESSNHYCNSLIRRYESVEDALHRIDACQLPLQLSSGKYVKVNFQNFVTRGTVEFRHHHGTHSAEKIVNWVVLTQAMMSRAYEYKVSKNVSEQVDYKHLVEALNLRSNGRKVESDDLGRSAHWYFYRAARQSNLAAA